MLNIRWKSMKTMSNDMLVELNLIKFYFSNYY